MKRFKFLKIIILLALIYLVFKGYISVFWMLFAYFGLIVKPIRIIEDNLDDERACYANVMFMSTFISILAIVFLFLQAKCKFFNIILGWSL